jgi:AcrR family transcriptional regulator
MVDLCQRAAVECDSVSTAAKAGPRERLLASAQRLTAVHGVGVGVDAILEDASVARRSLYQHFGGKDELIAASLLESARQDEERYRVALDSGGSDPRRRILAVFDQLDKMTSTSGFRGCRYVAAELALTDPDHPAHQVTRTYTERLHALFEKELTDLGHSDPSVGAEQIVVLIDGILVLAALRPGSHPAQAVRPLVEQLLDNVGSKNPPMVAR